MYVEFTMHIEKERVREKIDLEKERERERAACYSAPVLQCFLLQSQTPSLAVMFLLGLASRSLWETECATEDAHAWFHC